MSGSIDAKDRDRRDPSPYSKAWYEEAASQGREIVDLLVRKQFHGRFILETLEDLRLTLGRDSGIPDHDTLQNTAENRAAMLSADDWVMETIAGAQDRVAELWSENALRGFDIRHKAPRSKYQPPSETPISGRREVANPWDKTPSVQEVPPAGGDVA